jgi:hypothetical protein
LRDQIQTLGDSARSELEDFTANPALADRPKIEALKRGQSKINQSKINQSKIGQLQSK